MSDKKERIDHILTQEVIDNKDSAKLDSLLYRDKTKEDIKNKKKIKAEEDKNQNTSMLSFMWGDDMKGKRKQKAAAQKKKLFGAKIAQYDDSFKQDEKTSIRERKDTVEISRNGISLKLSESEEGKLKLKIFTGKKNNISKKRLAKIAMNAIIKELKKEE